MIINYAFIASVLIAMVNIAGWESTLAIICCSIIVAFFIAFFGFIMSGARIKRKF